MLCWMEVVNKEPLAPVTFCLSGDLSWSLSVLGKEPTAPRGYSYQDPVSSVAALTTLLRDFQVCRGNPEEFVAQCQLRNGRLHNRTCMLIVMCYLMVVNTFVHLFINTGANTIAIVDNALGAALCLCTLRMRPVLCTKGTGAHCMPYCTNTNGIQTQMAYTKPTFTI